MARESRQEYRRRKQKQQQLNATKAKNDFSKS